MKTAGYSSFRVLDSTSPELQDDNRTIEMNNENRIIVVNFDENIAFILPEQTPDNKQIQIVTHGNVIANVTVFPFGTTQTEINEGATPLGIISGTAPTTLTFQFLNGVAYVTKSVGSSDTIETEVSFTFAQIRAMGTTPLVLLTAPGAGMYNDISGITQQYKHVGVAYTAATASTVDLKIGSVVVCQNAISQLTTSVSSVIFCQISASETLLNTAITATTNDASDLTLGTGTLKFIISYKIRTVA